MAGSSKLTKIPNEVRDKAKALYFDHIPINDIAHQLQISTAIISKWRGDDNWAALRGAAVDGYLDDISSGRAIRLSKIQAKGLDALDRAVTAAQQRVDPLTLSEAEKLGNVMTILDKLQRLDRGKSTENHAVKVEVSGQVSVDKIREIFLNDPFFKETDSET